MSHERPTQPAQPRPYELFGFTKEECLDGNVNQERFHEIIKDEQTAIHSVEESCNNYGEFLFVTISRPTPQRRICMTFYGLGFHEYRERWLTDEWFWHQTPAFPDVVETTTPKGEADDLIKERLESISPFVKPDTQSARGRLFEMLADLTDEDGAYAELQDLGDLLNWPEEDDLDRIEPSRSVASEEGGESVSEQTSQIVKAGANTYFMDLKETRDGKPYLMITESRFKGEGKERRRTSIAVFEDHARDFLQALQEMVSLLG
jgi:hypothetical protein